MLKVMYILITDNQRVIQNKVQTEYDIPSYST